MTTLNNRNMKKNILYVFIVLIAGAGIFDHLYRGNAGPGPARAFLSRKVRPA